MKTPVRTTGIVALCGVKVAAASLGTVPAPTSGTLCGAGAVCLAHPCGRTGVPFPRVLSIVDVAVRPDFAIRAVTCQGGHAGWSEPEARGNHQLVLVRRGRFRREAAGVASDLDGTTAYLSAPRQEERFAHPAGGDVCTAVTLSPTLWHTIAGPRVRVPRPTVYVDARLDAAHRRCLAAARGGDVDFALVEELLGMLVATLARAGAGIIGGGPRPADLDLVATAREAIREDDRRADGLLSLAGLLGVSPYRLSRAFSREVGTSLTRYRNRVRVGRALDRLEDGERDLAGLAAELRFVDQAHLSRTVREHTGHTPRALRRLLAE